MDQYRIAYIEDDEATRLLISSYLEQAGFAVSFAENIQDAKTLLNTSKTDLLLLDLNLPDGDGLQLLHYLQAKKELPIIMTTSRNGVNDRIAGLELGADDYLCKPFEPSELIARIRSVLRRSDISQHLQDKYIKIGRFSLDLQHGTLNNSEGAAPKLTSGEMNLLCRLVRAKGSIVSRDQLITALSSRAELNTDRSIDVLISRLRHKLEVDPKEPTLLLTEFGRGYRLNV
ncbi:response regulator transcription factor [Pseudomonadota bacterium]